MKTLLLSTAFAITVFAAFARDGMVRTYEVNNTTKNAQPDSVNLKTENNTAYYQNVVKVDSNITENLIYVRTLQFMASKNFQQTYGYEPEGKLIFTTTQDLNLNAVSTGDDYESVDPYTVQFAVTMDMKNHRYRYTIHNVLFYLPTESGNRRLTLYDIYLKANNRDSKRIARDAKKLIASFEKYITALTNELYLDIEQKSAIHNSKF
jgi:hypothetical protein